MKGPFHLRYASTISGLDEDVNAKTKSNKNRFVLEFEFNSLSRSFLSEQPLYGDIIKL